jgi:hypothetical protein
MSGFGKTDDEARDHVGQLVQAITDAIIGCSIVDTPLGDPRGSQAAEIDVNCVNNAIINVMAQLNQSAPGMDRLAGQRKFTEAIADALKHTLKENSKRISEGGEGFPADAVVVQH